MTTIKAIIRNGRIELADPIDLPDGTVITIPVPNEGAIRGRSEIAAHEQSESAADWIRWYDALEPLEFTEEERKAWQAARESERIAELAQWEQRSRSVEGPFS